jgi:uncharacterized repeat protein (TIGR01451 family)
MTRSSQVLTLSSLLSLLYLVQPIWVRASSANVASPEPLPTVTYSCATADLEGDALESTTNSGGNLTCVYVTPAATGTCIYSDTNGNLLNDADGGFCPSAAHENAPLAPTFSKAFGSATVPQGGTTTLTFTIGNPNTVALAGMAFSDYLSGFQVGLPNGLSNSCGGVVQAPPGAGGVFFSFGTVAASSTCQISVNLMAGSPGTVNNTATLTSYAPTPPAATASIVVTGPPTFSKAFGVPSITMGNTTTLTFTITNQNPTALTSVVFTDALPSGLAVASPSGLASTCGGAITATAGAPRCPYPVVASRQAAPAPLA